MDDDTVLQEDAAAGEWAGEPFDCLRLSAAGALRFLTLDRPPVNAFSAAMYDELATACSLLGRDVHAQALVIDATGPHFSAGQDLAELCRLDQPGGRGDLERIRAALAAVYRLDIPVICAVHAGVIGAGVGIAACADMIVAAEGAFFQLPELRIGMIGGATHMKRLAPPAVVRRMVLTGGPVAVEELATYGAITSVVPRHELQEYARDLAVRVSAHDPIVVALAKQALRATETARLLDGYAIEHMHGEQLLGETRAVALREAATRWR